MIYHVLRSCVYISCAHLSDILYICYFICSARAKALEIQKKKDRDALKAKIAREKEEEKQKQIQQAKDKQAAKLAMKQKMIQDAKDKAAAIEQEKREAKGIQIHCIPNSVYMSYIIYNLTHCCFLTTQLC